MATAYSYTRFSGIRQAKGDSERRQTMGVDRVSESPESWCRRNGHTLDTSLRLRDRGRSAFHGHHLQRGESKGALGQFLDLIKDGVVTPGSFLLIEHIDRASRMPMNKALPFVMEFLSTGVNIVTLMDGVVYSAESLNDTGRMVTLIILLAQAHEESAKKHVRSKGNWEAKLKMAREKKQRISKRCPSWIDPESGQAIPEKAAIVRRCFAMALDGMGCRAIAKQLTAESIKPIGKATIFHSALVTQYLHSRAVLGEYQPCRIVLYFPRISSLSCGQVE